MSPKKLLFATAGIPYSTPDRNTVNGITHIKTLGLDAMELEFVRSINISKEKAPEVKKAATKNNVLLTCHASYFINLNAQEAKKKYASMYRIEQAAERLHDCGGWSVCFHPGFYLKMKKQTVYDTIKKRINEVKEKIDDKGYDVWLRPETTGKPTQFGDFIELSKLSSEIEGVMPVVDFSHVHARTNGKYNTTAEFKKILETIENYLGKEGLDNMHIHLSGINYGEKGEKNHLILEESDMNYKDLLKVWKEFNIKGSVVCESPNIEDDALLLKNYYDKL